jgi:exopolysaccharide biosynthesis WecB/TagA/CpsF family protein
MDTVSLLGTSFADLTLAAARDWVLARGTAPDFAYVVTPNADHLQRLRRVPRLRPVYAAAALRLLDSRCLAYFARRLGLAVPGVVTGAGLTAALLPGLAGQRVAVVGLRPAVLATLAARYRDITFLHHAPPMGLLRDPRAVLAARDFVLTARAPYVFFALGSPVQELLAYAVWRHPEATGTGLCVGAGLEFAAGTKSRAPVWMRQAGLEWLYRFNEEPLRLGPRYLLDNPPLLLALLAAARQKNAGNGTESH